MKYRVHNLYYWFGVGEGTLPLHHLISDFVLIRLNIFYGLVPPQREVALDLCPEPPTLSSSISRFYSPLTLLRPGGEGRRSAMVSVGGFVTESSASRGGSASRGRGRKRGTTDACSVLAPDGLCAGPFQQRDTMATRARQHRPPRKCRHVLRQDPGWFT
jgi:hypothetical protein